jgi:hypothetical protein
MKKYNSEDYFSVINKNTGKKIVDCSDELDALAMVAFDPQNRTITRNKFMMGPVVDIEMPKALPTNEIVAVHTVSAEKFDEYSGNLLKPNQSKLPEGKQKPVII